MLVNFDTGLHEIKERIKNISREFNYQSITIRTIYLEFLIDFGKMIYQK